MADLVALARQCAYRAHRDQVDKCSEPYIHHPERVAAMCAQAGFDEYVVAAAWLHDVVEDTDVTLDDLARTFPQEIIDAVNALSKRKGERFEDYYERVKANTIATVVKWHDVADNARPERLSKVAPDTQERLRAKYERARNELQAATVWAAAQQGVNHRDRTEHGMYSMRSGEAPCDDVLHHANLEYVYLHAAEQARQHPRVSQRLYAPDGSLLMAVTVDVVTAPGSVLFAPEVVQGHLDALIRLWAGFKSKNEVERPPMWCDGHIDALQDLRRDLFGETLDLEA